MSIHISNEKPLQKFLINYTSTNTRGLKLKIHYVEKGKSTRLRYASFHTTKLIVSLATIGGNLIILDFGSDTFWSLPKLESCCFLKFSNYRSNELLVAYLSGCIAIIDIDNGQITGYLKAHSSTVKNISFSTENLCLTCSSNDAYIWDLSTNSKLQVLTVNTEVNLKIIQFMPGSNNVLGCFVDGNLQIWKCGTFDTLHKINTSQYANIVVKTVTFTKNGSTMVIGGSSAKLIVFYVNTFLLMKIIDLPSTNVQSVKYMEFISMPNDGGCNKILCILSCSGNIVFYNIEDNTILNSISTEYEINRINTSIKGHYLAGILSSGSVEIYNILYFVMESSTSTNQALKSNDCSDLNVIKQRPIYKDSFSTCSKTTDQMKDILEFEKLKLILRVYNEFPDNYRVTIWERLLQLPRNVDQYNSIVNHETMKAFCNLEEKYPLEDRRGLKNLRQLLNNLVVWCPFLTYVDYLPEFVFPFVKVFHNKPLICFEAVCTIIVNWCQFWFEYFPLPPHNILTLIENTILHFDNELLGHLRKCNISVEIYVWPLLKTAFTHVLIAHEWLMFWDHVLANEVSFLLVSCAAYNILKRSVLLALNQENSIKQFYQTQNVVNVKPLLRKAYYLLKSMDDSIHPKFHLNAFRKIDCNQYPVLVNYPSDAFAKYNDKICDLRTQVEITRNEEFDVIRQHLLNLNIVNEVDSKNIEKQRVQAIQEALQSSISSDKEQLFRYQKSICDLQKALIKENLFINAFKGGSQNESLDTVKIKLNNAVQINNENEVETKEFENALLTQYSKLLGHKFKIDEISFQNGSIQYSVTMKALEKQQKELAKELDRIQRLNISPRELKLLNISTGVKILEDLIRKVEQQLDNLKYGGSNECISSNITKLQAEGIEVLNELNSVMSLCNN